MDKIQRHIDVEFPILIGRVDRLEEKSDRMAKVEAKVELNSNEVNGLKAEFKELSNKFDTTADAIKKSNTSFKLWLIGIVLASLIGGLSIVTPDLKNISETIHKIDKRLDKVEGE